MNYREEEIVRTEKISYRKDSMSAKTKNSQIAYNKSKKQVYTCVVYSIPTLQVGLRRYTNVFDESKINRIR